MTTNTDNPSGHDDIEMLLPWYVTGKLDEADRERVDAYLARHPELRARLDLSKAERNETAFLNKPVPKPSEATVERFMAQLGERKSATRQTTRASQQASDGPLAWIRDHLIEPLLNPAQLSWGVVAAAFVIVLQAAVIATLLSTPQPGAVYQTASGDTQSVAPGTYVDVRFVDDARASDIAAVMTELNMTIAGGPKAGGFFVVRIGPEDMDSAESARQIAALKEKSDLVMFVTGAR